MVYNVRKIIKGRGRLEMKSDYDAYGDESKDEKIVMLEEKIRGLTEQVIVLFLMSD